MNASKRPLSRLPETLLRRLPPPRSPLVPFALAAYSRSAHVQHQELRMEEAAKRTKQAEGNKQRTSEARDGLWKAAQKVRTATKACYAIALDTPASNLPRADSVENLDRTNWWSYDRLVDV
jgi:hypothetical protein